MKKPNLVFRGIVKPTKYNKNVDTAPQEVNDFIEERREEYLEFLVARNWEDHAIRRKNFAWNHPGFSSFCKVMAEVGVETANMGGFHD